MRKADGERLSEIFTHEPALGNGWRLIYCLLNRKSRGCENCFNYLKWQYIYLAASKADTEKHMLGYIRKSVLGLVAAMGLLMAGSAFAATYNIVLKDIADANIACTSGGFSFTKTVAGTFPTSGASVILTGCPTSFVPGIANGTYTPGSLSVVVQDITTPQPQGPNVEGLTGTLQFATTAPGTCQGTGSTPGTKTYTITFSYGGVPNSASRTFTLTCSGPGTFSTNGRYDVRNTAASVPEPETLLLMLAGLGGYSLVTWRRRKNRV
jgi:hypothetical protein